MSYYSVKNFRYVMFQKGGYSTDESIALDLVDVIDKKKNQCLKKITDGFTKNEEFVIASHFEFSPSEFCDTFLNGLFRVNAQGHYVVHVDNPKLLLVKPKRQYSKRKVKTDEILAGLDELEGETDEL